ncbi:MAG: alpha/beta hydrolase-fold protein [Planctomycetota bacterium]
MRLGFAPLLFVLLTPALAAQANFRVTLDGSARSEPARGRLVVFVIREGSRVADREPIDGPFWDDPQPLFGLDAELAPGASVVIDDRADAFPLEPSQLAPGKYRAQARFDLVRANSEWRREPGNLWSDAASFEVVAGKSGEVALALTHVVAAEPLPKVEGVEWFELRSELLSKFRGHDVFLRAGVVLPKDYDPARKYPAQYEVPGFGGDHRGAAGGRRRRNAEEGPTAELARASFRVVLDPEGPNGHSLFADSENNGPCGAALVEELIPALEKKYPLIAAPGARILRGHSSGGWSTLWLALTYPETFGASWSTAPDPVDFRRFQLVDIYGGKSFYVDASGADLASLRSNGGVKMTIRQEARGEDILGPDNTSGQQWDSWFATFGPKNERGNPAALFDPESGALDPKVAAAYRKYDLGELLRTQPARYLPLFRTNIHLVCGTEDSFYLNEAVQLLAEELAKQPRDAADSGYVKLVPGDHGSVFGDPAMQAIPGEVLTHFRTAGHTPAGN